MIEEVEIKKVIRYSDDRGFFSEIYKDDDPFFKEIKQTSFTCTYPGVIKAFHYHKEQDDIWFASEWMAQVVLYDMRENSPTYKYTQAIYMGEDNPLVVYIPKGVAHRYRVLGLSTVGLFYHTTKSYNPDAPDEYRISYDSDEIGFDWTTKKR